MTRIIGLTGYRQTGKSTIAGHLLERHGFVSIHAFSGGKAAAEAYFRHLGADAETAFRMTHGDLRDLPSPFLPLRKDAASEGVTTHYSPRFFLEMFGSFMGETLGPEWTAGAEIRLAQAAHPGRDLLIESVVYEEDAIRSAGGLIIRVDRPGSRGRGLKSDRAVDTITPDAHFLNDFPSVDLMLEAFTDRFLTPEPCLAP